MPQLPNTTNSLVLRTDFNDDEAWNQIKDEISQPNELGFDTPVEFVDDRGFQNFTADQIRAIVPAEYPHTFMVIADHQAMISRDHAMLIIDVSGPVVKSFRAITSQIGLIVANLSIANMDFDEFADVVDASGVFRGIEMP